MATKKGLANVHKHTCLNCDRIIAEGDFDCEIDDDHDFSLCDDCVSRGVDPNNPLATKEN